MLFITRYLCLLFVINRAFILFIVRLFVLFSFSLILCLFIVQKRKEQFWSWTVFRYFDPVRQKKLPVQVPVNCFQHHHLKSMNIIQQSPPTLSQPNSIYQFCNRLDSLTLCSARTVTFKPVAVKIRCSWFTQLYICASYS